MTTLFKDKKNEDLFLQNAQKQMRELKSTIH